MTNRASVLWKILKGLAKKWPEMVVQWTIVTTRLGETVFIRNFEMLTININVTEHVYKKPANPTGAHQEYWHNGISKRHTLIVSKGFRQNHIYCLSFEV